MLRYITAANDRDFANTSCHLSLVTRHLRRPHSQCKRRCVGVPFRTILLAHELAGVRGSCHAFPVERFSSLETWLRPARINYARDVAEPFAETAFPHHCAGHRRCPFYHRHSAAAAFASRQGGARRALAR